MISRKKEIAYKAHIEEQDVPRLHIQCSMWKIGNTTQVEVVLFEAKIVRI